MLVLFVAGYLTYYGWYLTRYRLYRLTAIRLATELLLAGVIIAIPARLVAAAWWFTSAAPGAGGSPSLTGFFFDSALKSEETLAIALVLGGLGWPFANLTTSLVLSVKRSSSYSSLSFWARAPAFARDRAVREHPLAKFLQQAADEGKSLKVMLTTTDRKFYVGIILAGPDLRTPASLEWIELQVLASGYRRTDNQSLEGFKEVPEDIVLNPDEHKVRIAVKHLTTMRKWDPNRHPSSSDPSIQAVS